MDEVSAAGAEAVAVYFLQLYPYVYATGDLTEWRALSHPECIFCASVITNVEEQVAAGNRSIGGLIQVDTVISNVVTPGSWFSVQVDGVQGPWAAYGADGTLLDQQVGTLDHTFRLAVVRQEGRWSVRAVQVDDAPE